MQKILTTSNLNSETELSLKSTHLFTLQFISNTFTFPLMYGNWNGLPAQAALSCSVAKRLFFSHWNVNFQRVSAFAFLWMVAVVGRRQQWFFAVVFAMALALNDNSSLTAPSLPPHTHMAPPPTRGTTALSCEKEVSSLPIANLLESTM